MNVTGPHADLGLLAGCGLFVDATAADLTATGAALRTTEHAAGQVLFHQGDDGDEFVVVLRGELTASRSTRGGDVDLGSTGSGSIVGELAMLTGSARRATVVASEPTVLAWGGVHDLDLLLDVPGVLDRLQDSAAERLAISARLVPVELRDGTSLIVRPLLATDRDGFAAAMARQPRDWWYRRFFSGGPPSERLIDYLAHPDYVDHFAWVAGQASTAEGVAVGRYIRSRRIESLADLAFEVTDEWRGKGIGTLLLGALGAAGAHAGIETFRGDVLADNDSMRAVFDKAGATWARAEPGVVAATMSVERARALLPEPQRTALGDVAHDIVSAAGIARWHR